MKFKIIDKNDISKYLGKTQDSNKVIFKDKGEEILTEILNDEENNLTKNERKQLKKFINKLKNLKL